ncbi:MAG: 50S ribosomal protein L23 [Chlamydiae bacterium]|nr:50S ribosomal protein L23 [Chlamydiota bacterium]
MLKKSPYDVVITRYITEKASVLEGLKNATSNPCLAKCDSPKYLFLVDKRANKQEIAEAVEEIYAERSVKVVSVNTITIKPKKRRVRGRAGFKAGFKKAVVTLGTDDSIDDEG